MKAPQLYIARDRVTGSVHLFDRRPVNDDGRFLAPTNFDEGIYLGTRPKLDFPLKRGEIRKVKLVFQG